MIRQATKQDIPALVEMMRQYALESSPQALRAADNHDANHVTNLIFQIVSGRGFALVDDDYRGMLLAMVAPNLWCPKVLILHELAWWVKHEHRNGTLGGRLWAEFNLMAQSMVNSGRVAYACTTVMANSPLIDYTKRGYKPLEATFFKE
jgi:N-acetylglutamate synthase-like GNAT family acetyltransferase